MWRFFFASSLMSIVSGEVLEVLASPHTSTLALMCIGLGWLALSNVPHSSAISSYRAPSKEYAQVWTWQGQRARGGAGAAGAGGGGSEGGEVAVAAGVGRWRGQRVGGGGGGSGRGDVAGAAAGAAAWEVAGAGKVAGAGCGHLPHSRCGVLRVRARDGRSRRGASRGCRDLEADGAPQARGARSGGT